MFKVKLQPTKDEAGAGERSRTRVRPRWSDAYLLYPISTRQTKVPRLESFELLSISSSALGLLETKLFLKGQQYFCFLLLPLPGGVIHLIRCNNRAIEIILPGVDDRVRSVAPPFILSSLFSHCWKRIRQRSEATRSGISVTVSGLSHPPFSSSRLLSMCIYIYIYLCTFRILLLLSEFLRRPNRGIPALE